MPGQTQPGAGAYVKRAGDPCRAAYLKAEAEILVSAAHPGVVEVIRSEACDADGWELVLREVARGDLTRQAAWAADEVAGYGAAAATILADLHDLGIVHGRIGPEHLLVDDTGRPLVCGFGHARRWWDTEDGIDTRPADVAALARCLASRLPPGSPRELRHALARAFPAGRHRPPTARQLARALSTAAADPRLPSGSPPVDVGIASGLLVVDEDFVPDPSVVDLGAVSRWPAVDSGLAFDRLVVGGGDCLPTGPAPAEPGDPVAAEPGDPVAPAIASARLATEGGSCIRRRVVGSGAPALHLPSAASTGGARPGGGRKRKVLLGSVGVLAVLASLAAGLLVISARSPGRGQGASIAAPARLGRPRPSERVMGSGSGCPPVDDGCRPLASPGGVLTLPTGRYRIGLVGDVAVLGRWTCTAAALPALLRPSTGQVWVFDRWARAGDDVTARLVAIVAGSRSLRVLAGRRDCDRLEVLRHAGSPVVVAPGAP